MSQFFSQNHGASRISLAITKFSHNTCSFGTRNFTWIHTSRSDLDFVLEEVRVVDDLSRQRAGVVMKITAGSEVLESQELGELIDMHRSAVDGERPVEVVTKSPFLAIRYAKSGNMVRRIQVRFRTEEDFNQAIRSLAGLGLPTSGKDSVTSITNQTTTSDIVPVMHHSDSRPSFDAPVILRAGPMIESGNSVVVVNGAYPLSMAHFSTSQRASSTLHSHTTSHLPTLRIASGIISENFSHTAPIKEVFKVPARPSSVIPEVARIVPVRPSSAASCISLPSMSNFSMGREEASPDLQTQLHSIYLPQIQKESGRRFPSSQSPQDIDLNSVSRYIATTNINSHTQQLGEGGSRQSHQLHNLPCLPTISHHFPQSQQAPIGLRFSTEDPFSDSLPTNKYLSQLYDDMIPPKRELPFKRPQSSGVLTSTTPILPPRAKSVLASGALSAEKVGITTDVTVTAQSISKTPKPTLKKRIAQRKSSIKPKATAKQSDIPSVRIEEQAITNTNFGIHGDVSPLAAKSASISSPVRPDSVPLGLVSKVAPPAKKRAAPAPLSAEKRVKMVDQSTQTLLIKNPPLATTALTLNTPEVIDSSSSPMSPPESYMTAIDNLVTRYKGCLTPVTPVKPTEIWDSVGYTEMDEEKRLDLVNDFLCRSLGDAQFVKLCEDMEHSWRHIGFM